jgi:uncharacterized hydrophobic protein (TIGR00341 family)
VALRLVEIIVPTDQAGAVREVLDEAQIGGPWHETLDDGRILVRLLLEAEKTGPIVDQFEQRFGGGEHFQLVILAVEAALPRMGESSTPPPAEEAADTEPSASAASGLSRQELQEEVRDMSRLSRVFLATVVLSTIVAAVGLLRDNVAVIIGAMVIAPLLGPNVAMAFGTTLGDPPLLRQATLSNAVGFLIAFVLAVGMGLTLQFDPAAISEIDSRTEVGLSDIVLALAAGAAGVLVLTSGVSTALVGVMVAVALLPPTVVFGLMLGSARWELAYGAGMLLATNVICVNLAGVVTFLLQGVRPLTWWETDRARRSSRIALSIWVTLLVGLAVLIVIGRQ